MLMDAAAQEKAAGSAWWENTGNPRGQWWLKHSSYQGAEADEIWKQVKIPPSPVLTPAEALRSFHLPPDLRMELVAAEPLITRPVHMQFDAAGRLWVVEMPGYMRDLDGSGEAEPSGRLVVLEDTDGDGRMDKATTFLDGLVMPRTVSFVAGGVLVVEPPTIWYVQDTDGDLIADRKTALAENYGDVSNPEHSANGLLRAIDNYLYSAKSAIRYRFQGGSLHPEPTLFRGQWGIAQDDTGRLYYNYNHSPVHTEVVPGEYLQIPGKLDFSQARNILGRVPANVSLVSDPTVYPARVTPLVTLGATDLRPDGTLKKFTAACGPLIYRGDALPPGYRGNVFVCDPVGNLVSRYILDPDDPVKPARRAYAESEFLTSSDERFRPVLLENGPDGALYVLDMYTPLVEHKRYVTEYLRNQVLSRNLNEFTATGRIYRIVARQAPQPSKVTLADQSPEDWVRLLSSPNGWVRDMAQRLLVDRGDLGLLPALRRAVSDEPEALGRLHALWTCEGLGDLHGPTVLAAMRDPDARIVAAALRLSERLAGNQAELLAPAYADLAKSATGEVRRQLLLALGKVNTPWADRLLARLLAEPADDWQSVLGAVAVRGREDGFLRHLFDNPAWAEPAVSRSRVLQQLGISLIQSSDPDRVERLFALLSEQSRSDWRFAAVVEGAASAKRPGSPLRLKQAPALVSSLQASTEAKERRWGEALAKSVVWGAVRSRPMVSPLSSEGERLFVLGRIHYGLVCAACHQPNGQGIPAAVPPLVGSHWVTGTAEAGIKIVLHGVTGPIEVNGETWNMTMPGFSGNEAALDDERIAGILTYIRREWGHEASPVTTEQVAEMRRVHVTRSRPWTADELLR